MGGKLSGPAAELDFSFFKDVFHYWGANFNVINFIVFILQSRWKIGRGTIVVGEGRLEVGIQS